MQKFQDHLSTTDFNCHFREMKKINGNRTRKQQISMIHIKTGIQCLLLFDDDNLIPDSAEILLRFQEKIPMCKYVNEFACFDTVYHILIIRSSNFAHHIRSTMAKCIEEIASEHHTISLQHISDIGASDILLPNEL